MIIFNCFIKVTVSSSSTFSCSRPHRLVWLIGHLSHANGIEYSFVRVLMFLLVLLPVLPISVRVGIPAPLWEKN